MLARVRAFFAERGVLEVETPVLSAGGATDPQIESLVSHITGLPHEFYLSTSPEFAMKRLLAAGSGDIYQLCKVFRDGERGRWHNPEFTLLEWYRSGFDDAALMSEVELLVGELLAPERCFPRAQRLTYAAAMRQYAGVDPHTADDRELDGAAQRLELACEADLDRDAKLDLLMGLAVGPQLGRERPCFICDYPASQASLARLKPGLPRVAARFELYLDGIELANGFHELANPALHPDLDSPGFRQVQEPSEVDETDITRALVQDRRFARLKQRRSGHWLEPAARIRHQFVDHQLGFPRDAIDDVVNADRL